MRLIATIAVACLTIAMFGCGKSSKAKQVKVDAQTIAALPADGTYAVDLYHDGTIYDFDPAAGPIDFKRVSVRSKAGEQPIGLWLGKASPKTALTGWETDELRLGTTSDFAREWDTPIKPPPSPPAADFQCDEIYCICRGIPSCRDMLHVRGLCKGPFFACVDVNGFKKCICSFRPE